MKKDVKLYNMILPPFMLFFFVPILWIVSALGNFIIDSIVLLIISIKNSIFRNSLIFQGLPPIKYQNLMYFPLFLPL